MKTGILTLLLLIGVVNDGEAQRWTTVTDAGVFLTDTSSQVLASNNNRSFLRLENASDTRISCRFTTTAVPNRAFSLAPRGTVGDVIVFSMPAVSIDSLNCILPAGTAGGKLLMILEGKQIR